MKKQYARPELRVIEMNLHETMLCGSITDRNGRSITDRNGNAIDVDYYLDEDADESEAL